MIFVCLFMQVHGVSGGILFFVFPIDIFSDKELNRCKDGHTDEHTQRSHDSTADEDGKDNPQGTEVYGFAQNLWPQNIAVELLQNQNENADYDGKRRVNQKRDKDCRNCTDEGSEIGNHIGHADDECQNQREGRLDNRQPDEGKDTDNQRVNRLADDEVLEDMMDTVCLIEELFGSFLCGEGINPLVQLFGKTFLIQKHIEGNEDCHDEIYRNPPETVKICGNRFQ